MQQWRIVLMMSIASVPVWFIVWHWGQTRHSSVMNIQREPQLTLIRPDCPSSLTNSTPTTTTTTQNSTSPVPNCPSPAANHLGPIFTPWNVTHLTDEILTRFITPRLGGLWSPSACRASHRVAVMVPYRDRVTNLRIFTVHMHHFLQSQSLDYGIFIIEQADSQRFNRAKLFNAGYHMIQSYLPHTDHRPYDCFVLHDIDKLPEDTRILYHCHKDHPRQMPAKFRQAETNRTNNAPYSYYFGGVTMLHAADYEKVNGMTNTFWGWGGEDDEFFCRVKSAGLEPTFESRDLAVFMTLPHAADAQYSGRPMPNCKQVAKQMHHDGLRNVNYTLIGLHLLPHYTIISVKL